MSKPAPSAVATEPETAPAPVEAPTGLGFEDVEVPAPKATGGRTAAPNPFAEKVGQLAAEWADGRSAKASRFIVPAAELKTRKRQLQSAAATVGKSARVDVHELPDGETVSVVFWLVEKITRKTSATAVPSPAE